MSPAPGKDSIQAAALAAGSLTTVAAALRAATLHLEACGIQRPREDAEVLLAAVLNRDRTFLFTYPEEPFSPDQALRLAAWLEKRGAHYPLQYLLGRQEFFGREFQVTPGVFIPRPETELLIETALEWLQELPDAHLTAADIATGTGCIAVTLACEEPRLSLVATDISLPALELARVNAAAHGCSRRIQWVEGTLPAATSRLPGGFHLLVSNPPYVSMLAREEMDLSVAWYEPPEALYASDSGRSFYLHLFSRARPLLRPGGRLVLELGSGAASLVEAAERSGWALKDLRQDLAGHDRCAVFQPTGGRR